MTLDLNKPPQIKKDTYILEYDNGYKILALNIGGEQRFYKLTPNQIPEIRYHGKVFIRELNQNTFEEKLILVDSLDNFYPSEADAHNSMPVTTQNNSVKKYLTT